MARWLRTGALLAVALAVCFVPMLPRASAGTILTFGCDYSSGINGGPIFNVVGWQSGAHTFAGYEATIGQLAGGGCGNLVAIPNSSSVQPVGISPDSFIVGRYADLSSGWHAFVLNPNGSLFSFNSVQFVLGGQFTHPAGITASTFDNTQNANVAWVVGTYLTGSKGAQHSFVLEVNTSANPMAAVNWTSFDLSGAVGTTSARGINAGRQVVGQYTDASKQGHGFVAALPTSATVSAFARVDCAGATATVINGISDKGRIVGSAATGSIAGYAYYAEPPGAGWQAGNSYTVNCIAIPIPGATSHSQNWAAGISADGTQIVGHGGSAGNFVYTP